MSSIYADLKGDEWFYLDTVAAKELGLMGGYPDGTFRPDEPLTRAQGASIIRRLAEALNRIQSLETARLINRLEALAPVVKALKTVDGEPKLIGAGSAVWLGKGYAVTCTHVIQGADMVKFIWPNVLDWDARVIATKGDLALCLVQAAAGFPAAKLGSAKNLQAGATVFTVGNSLDLGVRVARGEVARDGGFPLAYRVGEQVTTMTAIDHTAAMSPGNSGGGLFDAEGRLIGVTNAGIPAADSMNFAIPVEDVQALCQAQGIDLP